MIYDYSSYVLQFLHIRTKTALAISAAVQTVFQ